MKKLQRLCVASLFTVVFTTATFAGEIATGKAPPPPDDSLAITLGDIHTGGNIQNPQGTSDSGADIALNLLQTILSVF
jgi:hypothetical protein